MRELKGILILYSQQRTPMLLGQEMNSTMRVLTKMARFIKYNLMITIYNNYCEQGTSVSVSFGIVMSMIIEF